MLTPEDSDYLKLYRKIEHSAVFASEPLLKTWIWCLCKAGYKDRVVPLRSGRGITEIHLKRGQFIFGRHTAAEALNMKESSVWKRMKKLEKLGNVNISSNSLCSVITVVNWQIYQPTKEEMEQAKEQVSNSEGTAKGQRSNTNKKGNKGNKVKNLLGATVIPECFSSGQCQAALIEWLEYKLDIGKFYKSSKSFQGRLTRMENQGWDSSRLIDAIQYSVSQGYDGIHEEKGGGKTNERKDIQPSLDW